MSGKIGQIAGAAAGFVIGTAAGNPAIGASIGASLGSSLDAKFAKRRGRTSQRPGLDNALSVQGASYGVPIDWQFGTGRKAGNIFWIDSFRQESEVTGDIFEYTSIAVGLCQGPKTRLLRVWADGELIIDFTSPTGLDLLQERFGSRALIKLYPGTEDQEVDPYMAATDEDLERLTPAYRGLCYVMLTDLLLAAGSYNPGVESFRRGLPWFEFEVSDDVEESVPYEPLPIVPEVTVPNPPENDWAGTVVNALAFASRDYKETANGLVEQDSPTMLTISSAGNYLDVNVDVPGQVAEYSFSAPNSGGSLSGTDFGSNQVWVHLKFRRVLSPQGGVSCVLTMRSGTGRLMSLQWNANGTFSMLDASDTVVATGSRVVPADGSFHRLDVFHGPGTGITHYRLYIDGVLDIDSNATASTGQKRFVLLGPVWAGSACQYHIADVVACIGAPLPLDEDYGVTRLAPSPSESGASVIKAGGWDAYVWNPLDSAWVESPGIIPINSVLSKTGIDDDERPRDPFGTCLIPLTVVDPDDYWILKCQPLGDDASTGKIYAVKAHFVWAKDAGSISGGARLALTTDTTVEDGVTAIRTTGTPGAPTDGTFGGRSIITKFRPGTSDYFTVQGVGTVYPAARGTSPADTVGPSYDVQACFGSAYLVVVHSALGHDTTTERIDAEDHLVLYPDEFRVCIMNSGVWYIYNTISKGLELTVELRDIGDQRSIIPFDGCDFDIDERGYIYTTRWNQDSGDTASLVRLDGSTLEVLAESPTTIDDPTRVRVFRNAYHPWLVVICDDGDSIGFAHRDELRWGGDVEVVAAPTDFRFVALTLDDLNGIVFALAVGATSANEDQTKVVVFLPYQPDVPVGVEHDISDEISYGAVIGITNPDLDSFGDPKTLMVGTRDTPERIAFYQIPFPGGFGFDEASDVTLDHQGNATGNVVPPNAKSAWRRGVEGDHLFYAYPQSTIYKLSVRTRAIIDEWEVEPLPGDSIVPAWVGGNLFEARGSSIITGCDLEDAGYCRVYLGRAGASKVTVQSVVEAVCEAVEIESELVDASDLGALEMWGLPVTDRTSARDILDALAEVFFFDGVEIDGVLTFVRRGAGSVVAEIPAGDLAAHMEREERPQDVVLQRQQSVELPWILELAYRDYEREYEQQVASAFRQRTTTQSRHRPAYDTAVAFSSAEAQQVVEKRLKTAWIDRTRPVIQLGPKYLYLTPSDLIQFPAHGRSLTARIESIDSAPNGLLSLELAIEDSGSYVSDAGGIGQQPEAPSEPPGPTQLYLLDVGLLDKADDRPGVYMAVVGYTDSWEGAAVGISRDGGTSFQPWAASAELGVVGSALAALGDVDSPWIWDRANTISVQLQAGGTLSSSTEAAVMGGANRIALGNEIIGFVTATQTDADLNQWELSTLLRGRAGTESQTGSHAAGDRFAFLHPSVVDFVGLESGDEGLQRLYRAVSLGSDRPGVIQAFTAIFRNLLPLAPQHVQGVRGGDDDITIEWLRRSRYRGTGELGYSMPLGETSEAYEVDILSGPGGSVLRTLTSSSESVTYTEAQQLADFDSGLPDDLTVVVYQISSVVGRGYGTEATLEV